MDFETRKKKKERTILLSIVICVILMIATLFGIAYFTKADNAKFKVFIDGKQAKITNNFLLEQNGVRYVSIEELASILGYTYSVGNDKVATNTDECYIQTAYIRTSFTNNSKKFEKALLADAFDTALTMTNTEVTQFSNASVKKEIYNTNNPVLKYNEKLYLPLEDISKAIDVSVENKEPQRLRIYNLNALYISLMQNKSYAGYAISESYAVARSLANGILIYNTQSKWGAIDIYANKTILNPAYDTISYCANINKFIVNTNGEFTLYDTAGNLITENAKYDILEIMDQELELFLIQADNQYGVINGKGDIVVFPEYDQIGINDPTMYKNIEISNGKVLLGNMIPVKRNGKWGAFDIYGNPILPVSYATLGYNLVRNAGSSNIASTATNTENNLLIIPESAGLEGVVIGQEFGGTVSYGVVNKYGTFLIPCGCGKIYYKRENGKDTYILYYSNQDINYSEYVKKADIQARANENAFEGKVGDGMSHTTIETPVNGSTVNTNDTTNTVGTTNTVDTNTVNTNTVTNTTETY